MRRNRLAERARRLDKLKEEWNRVNLWPRFCLMWTMISVAMRIDSALSEAFMNVWNSVNIPDWRMQMYTDETGVYRPLPNATVLH